ncbi:MAG: hypothetical protein LBI77_01745 [Puniceicoccales bacterium]|jgi:hypothetical protein|nr:hypothetical protein [Puniceicoccales bacterium]
MRKYFPMICFPFFALPSGEGGPIVQRGKNQMETIQRKENTKEVRSFFKTFPNRKFQQRKLKTNKHFQKMTQFSQKKFNMHGLNRPFARPSRSPKIGTLPLHKL